MILDDIISPVFGAGDGDCRQSLRLQSPRQTFKRTDTWSYTERQETIEDINSAIGTFVCKLCKARKISHAEPPKTKLPPPSPDYDT
jgi:hypothetical protein